MKEEFKIISYDSKGEIIKFSAILKVKKWGGGSHVMLPKKMRGKLVEVKYE